MKRQLFSAVAMALLSAQAFAQQAAPQGNPDAAHRNKTAMCIGCHGIPGYHTAFPAVYHVPKIGGQQAGYIIAALKEYKSGARWHPSMRAIAGSLSEQDMADLAAYYSAPGTPEPTK